MQKPPNIRVVLDFDEQETSIYVTALKIMKTHQAANSTDGLDPFTKFTMTISLNF